MCHHRSFITPSAHHRIEVIRQCLSWSGGRLHKCAPKCYNNEASMPLSPRVLRLRCTLCMCVCALQIATEHYRRHACMRPCLWEGFSSACLFFGRRALVWAPTDEVIAQHQSRCGRVRASQRFASQAFDRCKETPARLDGGEASREGARPGLVLDLLDPLPASDGQSLPASLVWRVCSSPPSHPHHPSHGDNTPPQAHVSRSVVERLTRPRRTRLAEFAPSARPGQPERLLCLGPGLVALLSWRRLVVQFP
jgi:hypothetical protein